MKHAKNIFLVAILASSASLYSALTVAADSQNKETEKAETIKPIPSKWCSLWPSGVPLPFDFFKICRDNR